MLIALGINSALAESEVRDILQDKMEDATLSEIYHIISAAKEEMKDDSSDPEDPVEEEDKILDSFQTPAERIVKLLITAKQKYL